jgi:hypothetical protein
MHANIWSNKRLPSRLKSGWEDNNKLDLKAVGWEGVDWIHFCWKWNQRTKFILSPYIYIYTHPVYVFCLFFYFEDGASRFLRKVGNWIPDYIRVVSYPKGW